MTIASLFFIGLGLYDEQDLSLKALNQLKQCDLVFAECYTSQLMGSSMAKLEAVIGKPIKVLNREETEKGTTVLEAAQQHQVALLIGGDPMIATTHVDLRIRAQQKNIPTHIIHGSSIVTAVPGLLGLQNYKFGRATTLAYPEKDYFPTSPYDVIFQNKQQGLHTLVLLDIKAEENRFMTASEALDLLMQMEQHKQQHLFTSETILCVVARAGSDTPVVAAHTMQHLQTMKFGPPLHTLVVPGKVHFMEAEALHHLAGLPQDKAEEMQKL